MLPRRRLHRLTFLAAGVYNIAWGIYSALDPQWLFRFSGLPLANHPAVFECLGMVIGLYGILYLDVARVPEQGWLIAAVGLTGKILGPLGCARSDRPRAMAARRIRPLPDERPDLVVALRPLSERRLAAIRTRLEDRLTVNVSNARLPAISRLRVIPRKRPNRSPLTEARWPSSTLVAALVQEWPCGYNTFRCWSLA